MSKCECSMRISITGDGCRYCQPQEYIDRMGEWLDEERSEVERLNALVAMQAEALRRTREDLRACQAVIHLDGGFDPLYVSDAQASMKVADAALKASAKTVAAWASIK